MRRILIVESETLLGAGVFSLLRDETDLEILGMCTTNQVDLIHEINCFQPDVVILNATTQLTTPGKLLAAVDNHPQLRVLVVNADDNRVCIYGKHEVVMIRATDLLEIVRE